ncbi:hypothetical protein CEXT_629851 [Caerostris extrusa]|uniref:Uncharacterized protein n=1 Tax=Caerostris extrusa TaxID=172846 RepID=A0AAV4NGM7_CAEEX|nr:hypothetical protein CEXT_629851 [Caerostris extrusa]
MKHANKTPRHICVLGASPAAAGCFATVKSGIWDIIRDKGGARRQHERRLDETNRKSTWSFFRTDEQNRKNTTYLLRRPMLTVELRGRIFQPEQGERAAIRPPYLYKGWKKIFVLKELQRLVGDHVG